MMKVIVLLCTVSITFTLAFSPHGGSRLHQGDHESSSIAFRNLDTSLVMTASTLPWPDTSARNDNDPQNKDVVPPLRTKPVWNICLMVEPTPFTHVSGYSNRFREMLRFLSHAGDKVNVLTVDQATKKQQQPKSIFGYNIEHTFGLRFPLYRRISLSLDLPQFKGRRILKRMKKPDLIHVSSP